MLKGYTENLACEITKYQFSPSVFRKEKFVLSVCIIRSKAYLLPKINYYFSLFFLKIIELSILIAYNYKRVVFW